ncbi:MAG TPA: pyridoxal-phosphate dependent enzyme, partial [Saprospiraceae bacterium]|nr:pyridoxal-phosphate dependent enzyme [Saprospiraceae bacterium]
MKKLNNIPTLDDIQKVHEGIKPVIHQTPVLTCQSLNDMIGASLFFKCENFQKVGAFKMRGAASALLSLTEEEKQKGIATHSSGNHAQAVALNAKLNGIKAYIVMPKNSPKIKKEATAAYGAEITFSENTIESRISTLEKVIEETGARFIHPFDDYNIIAGQATAAKELIEEVGALDIVMAPVGGGGLMCGTALITHYLLP